MPSNYLLKVKGRYYFRIHIPLDLRRWFGGRREIKRSLRSGNLEYAKCSARHWVYRTERLFAQIRSGMLTNDRGRKLVADYFAHTLQETEDARISGVGVPADLEDHAEMVGIHETLLDEYRENLSLRKYEGVTRLVDTILEGAELKFKKGSRNYEKLCRGTLKGLIEATTIDIQRMKGDYQNEYDQLIGNIASPHSAATAGETPVIPVEMLSSLLEEFVREHAAGDHWTEKTKAENESIFKLFLGVMGDRDVRSLTHRELVEYREALKRFPSNANKKVAYRGKSIQEILQMDVYDPLSVTSVNKHLTRVGAFLKWATKNRYIERNYAEGLTMTKKGTRESEEREAYSQEDLRRLLASPLYSASPKATKSYQERPERYWVPLIALFSGMRQNEICQLHVSDVRVEDDTPCFDINDEGTKTLKTPSSKRLVPVHPELIRLGLLRYVANLKEAGAESRPYCSIFGFHSRAIRCASAISVGDI